MDALNDAAATAKPVDARKRAPRGSRREPAGALVRIGPPREKKPFVRAPPERSQRWRLAFQVAFLALNVAIGVQFVAFVHFFESGAPGAHPPRPPGVEGWLPIAALMNLKATVLTGELPWRFPAGMFLLVSFLGITFLFRKAFCSWLCPVGTISEWLWKVGHRLLGRTFALPRWLDVPLRSLKYVLLGLFLWAVGSMSVDAIHAFLASPYGIVADVKMLDFFRRMDATAAAVIAFLVAASMLVKNFWCRYLCPYGALHGLVSWLSPVRIRRDPDACIDCAKCAKACPSRLPVDEKRSIVSPECTGCMECVAACPVKGALAMSVTRRRALPGWAVAAGVAAIFLGVVGAARLGGRWHTDVDPKVYRAIVPRLSELVHPR